MLLNEGVWIPQLLQEEKIFEASFFISKLFVQFLEGGDTLLVVFCIKSGAFQCVPHKDVLSS